MLDNTHSKLTTYCDFTQTHYFVGRSAGSFTAIAGIFAAVLLPFLALIIVNPGEKADEKKRAGIRAPTLILAAFLMEIMAAYFFAVIGGDNSCIRVNMIAGPAAALFGFGTALSIVGVCWLAERFDSPARARQVFYDLSVATFLLIVPAVLFTQLQVVLSAEASVEYWPTAGDTSLILSPSVVCVAVCLLRYLGWIPAAVRRSVRKLFRDRIGEPGKWFHTLLPILYLPSLLLAFEFTNQNFDTPSYSFFWTLAAAVYALLFSMTMGSLIGFMPARLRGKIPE